MGDDAPVPRRHLLRPVRRERPAEDVHVPHEGHRERAVGTERHRGLLHARRLPAVRRRPPLGGLGQRQPAPRGTRAGRQRRQGRRGSRASHRLPARRLEPPGGRRAFLPHRRLLLCAGDRLAAGQAPYGHGLAQQGHPRAVRVQGRAAGHPGRPRRWHRAGSDRRDPARRLVCRPVPGPRRRGPHPVPPARHLGGRLADDG